MFVGVTNEPSEAQIKTFVAKMGANMTYPVALDPHGTVMTAVTFSLVIEWLDDLSSDPLARMSLTIFCDTYVMNGAGVVSSEWMGKYRVQGIPHAFVIARDGRLTWHGHPADPQFEHEIAAAAAASPAPNPSRTYTREELSGMSVKELKALLSARGVDASDCIEKSDLISRALQAS